MAIRALILYGSFARRDFTIDSDVDMLAVVDVGESLRRMDFSRLRMQRHTVETLGEMADSGSLFVWHLSTEGRVLYDTDGEIRDLLGSFRLKSNYSDERRQASEIGWMLLSAGVPNSRKKQALWIKTSMYCARTLALCELAERRDPVPAFSKKAMCEAFHDPLLLTLWKFKHKTRVGPNAQQVFEEFLRKHGTAAPVWYGECASLLLERNDLDSFTRSRLTRLHGVATEPSKTLGDVS